MANQNTLRCSVPPIPDRGARWCLVLACVCAGCDEPPVAGNDPVDSPDAGGVGRASFIVEYGRAGVACTGSLGSSIRDGIDYQLTTLIADGQTVCTSLATGPSRQVDNICDTPVPCVRSDQPQHTAPLAPGDYVLLIRGGFDRGAVTTSCFSGWRPFQVVDRDVDLGRLTVPFDDSEDSSFCGAL